MVSFLLIISFLLHLVAIAAIYKLFQQLHTFKTQDSTEIEALFDKYLQEIKRENSRLQEELQQEKHIQRPVKSEPAAAAEPADKSEADSDIEPDFLPADIEYTDTMEASLESRVLQLHQEGLSIGEIARKLNCGKTEAEIIVKMHQKNNINA
ncbi:DUF6115 domain-containing protein [Oceanobacillus massiliensis]|uniref:DUF6115 domain-containing protein n=1 Tax=Oceanobacillus massiliensis TaxID=1465765 RepID=UPI0002894554|nr:hypothetical protein [Oceanobacillus massiliensis]